MVLKNIIFILFLTILSSTGLKSQNHPQSSDTTQLIASKLLFDSSKSFQKNKILSPIRKDNYRKIHKDNLGIFCKFEDKASQRATVNLRMRLGSLPYVNQLEQKD